MTSLERSGLIGTILAASLVGIGCGNRTKAETSPENPTVTVSPDNIYVLDSVKLQSGPAISGDLKPEKAATIRAEIGASVERVNVEEGQRVQRDQLLATLDESAISERYRSARSRVTATENSAAVAKREAERARRLLQGGAVAERDVELAERAQIAAEAELEDARASLATAQREWQRTQIRAPFNGIVSLRNVSVGDVVQAGNELFQVVDPASMQLEAAVPVSAIGSLKVGSNVEFEVSGYEGQRFTGRIERINPMVDPGTRQVRIVVAIPNTGTLVAGLFARGRVDTEQKMAVAVPLTALDQRGAAPTVRRLKDGKVEVVAVQLGLRDDIAGLVEVTSGLARGDTLLTGGAMGTAAGTPVLVRKE